MEKNVVVVLNTDNKGGSKHFEFLAKQWVEEVGGGYGVKKVNPIRLTKEFGELLYRQGEIPDSFFSRAEKIVDFSTFQWEYIKKNIEGLWGKHKIIILVNSGGYIQEIQEDYEGWNVGIGDELDGEKQGGFDVYIETRNGNDGCLDLEDFERQVYRLLRVLTTDIKKIEYKEK